MPDHLTLAQVGRAIKAELRRRWPGVEFLVRSDAGPYVHILNIYWSQTGPGLQAVGDVCGEWLADHQEEMTRRPHCNLWGPCDLRQHK